MNVVCRSRETYIRLPVEKYELVRAPGIAAAARRMARAIAGLAVASPRVWKTTTLGARTPLPNDCSVRWLASYAGSPGTARLWYQRDDTFCAATAPTIVKMSQQPITGQRRRTVRCARRVSMRRAFAAGHASTIGRKAIVE